MIGLQDTRVVSPPGEAADPNTFLWNIAADSRIHEAKPLEEEGLEKIALNAASWHWCGEVPVGWSVRLLPPGHSMSNWLTLYYTIFMYVLILFIYFFGSSFQLPKHQFQNGHGRLCSTRQRVLEMSLSSTECGPDRQSDDNGFLGKRYLRIGRQWWHLDLTDITSFWGRRIECYFRPITK